MRKMLVVQQGWIKNILALKRIDTDTYCIELVQLVHHQHQMQNWPGTGQGVLFNISGRSCGCM